MKRASRAEPLGTRAGQGLVAQHKRDVLPVSFDPQEASHHTCTGFDSCPWKAALRPQAVPQNGGSFQPNRQKHAGRIKDAMRLRMPWQMYQWLLPVVGHCSLTRYCALLCTPYRSPGGSENDVAACGRIVVRSFPDGCRTRKVSIRTTGVSSRTTRVSSRTTRVSSFMVGSRTTKVSSRTTRVSSFMLAAVQEGSAASWLPAVQQGSATSRLPAIQQQSAAKQPHTLSQPSWSFPHQPKVRRSAQILQGRLLVLVWVGWSFSCDM